MFDSSRIVNEDVIQIFACVNIKVQLLHVVDVNNIHTLYCVVFLHLYLHLSYSGEGKICKHVQIVY